MQREEKQRPPLENYDLRDRFLPIDAKKGYHNFEDCLVVVSKQMNRFQWNFLFENCWPFVCLQS